MIEIKNSFPNKSWSIDQDGLNYGKECYSFHEIKAVRYNNSLNIPLTFAALKSGKTLSLHYEQEYKKAVSEAFVIFFENSIEIVEILSKKEQISKSLEDLEKNLAIDAEIIYNLKGSHGRTMKVYADRCTIKTNGTVSSLLTGNAFDGEKTIYYVDCLGVQFKKAYLNSGTGYIQLETASALMNNLFSNRFNENTFTFNNTVVKNETMTEVHKYINEKVSEIKSIKPQSNSQLDKNSTADEIKAFHEMMVAGIITQEEFEVKKKKLLNL